MQSAKRVLRILTVLLCAVLVVVVPSIRFLPVTKAATFLKVTNELHLTAEHSPYLLQGILVEESGKLVIEPNTEVFLAPAARIEVYGTFEVRGEYRKPVRISGSEAELWEGIEVHSQAQTVQLHWLELSGFRGPHIVHGGPAVTARHLTFIDGKENYLRLGSPGVKPRGAYSLERLTFANRLLGTAMGSSGVQAFGEQIDLDVNIPTFLDTRVLNERNRFVGVQVTGTYKGIVVRGAKHASSCSVHVIESVHQKFVQIGAGPGNCAYATIPLVFVPGYGTSINLAKLTSLRSEKPDLKGWRFFQGVTPAYSNFIRTVAHNGIPYDVAYYDWRRPADRIVEEYLIPVIERVKKQYNSPVVYLVGHSFGGIVARTYIQSNKYQGDVAQLVQLGTPNLGAAKAYSVWEAGELPGDWQTLDPLLRYYQYITIKEGLTKQEIVHRYIPSARELFPAYTAVRRANVLLPQSKLIFRNVHAEELQRTQSYLFARTLVTTYASTSEPTVEEIAVEDAPPLGQLFWADGELLSTQPEHMYRGDGTVPLSSVQLAGANNRIVEGKHAELPQVAAEAVLRQLYPNLSYQSLPPLRSANRSAKNLLWFLFDCPIEVTITLPDGRIRSTTTPDVSTLLEDDPNEVGEVADSKGLHWLILPKLAGNYAVDIHALDNTEVRAWVDTGPIQITNLKKNENRTWHYLVTATEEGSWQINDPILKEESTSVIPALPNNSPLATNTPASFVIEQPPYDALGEVVWHTYLSIPTFVTPTKEVVLQQDQPVQSIPETQATTYTSTEDTLASVSDIPYLLLVGSAAMILLLATWLSVRGPPE